MLKRTVQNHNMYKNTIAHQLTAKTNSDEKRKPISHYAKIVLRTIAANPEITSLEIISKCDMEKGTVDHILKVLLERDYVTRETEVKPYKYTALKFNEEELINLSKNQQPIYDYLQNKSASVKEMKHNLDIKNNSFASALEALIRIGLIERKKINKVYIYSITE